MESGIQKRKRNHGNGNGIRNQISMIAQSKREFVLVFLAVPLDIFLLLCLDKICRSVVIALQG